MDWTGYPRLELPLSCCGETHLVRWEAGRLIIPDHDDSGEAVLTALGGGEVACHTLATAWAHALAPGRSEIAFFLLLDGRRAKPVPTEPMELPRRPAGVPAPLVAADEDAMTSFHHRRVVCSLPFPWLLVAAAPWLEDLVAWEQIPVHDEGSIRMTVSHLAARALERAWPASRPQPRVQCDPWTVAGVEDRLIVLPPWWITRVAARAAEVIDDGQRGRPLRDAAIVGPTRQPSSDHLVGAHEHSGSRPAR